MLRDGKCWTYIIRVILNVLDMKLVIHLKYIIWSTQVKSVLEIDLETEKCPSQNISSVIFIFLTISSIILSLFNLLIIKIF